MDADMNLCGSVHFDLDVKISKKVLEILCADKVWSSLGKLPDYILGNFRVQVIELLRSHDLLKYRNTIGIPVNTGMHWIPLLMIYHVIEKKVQKARDHKMFSLK